MNVSRCKVPMPMATLIAYWLDELEGAEESQLEEHLFACAECSARLRELARLGEGVRKAARDGAVTAIVSAPFIERMQSAGARVRRYDVQRGGSVLCTVTPQDDLVVGYLHAPLADVARLDLEFHDSATNARLRFEDIPFDPAAREIVFVPSVVQMRKLGKTTQTLRLLAVAGGVERPLGEYTFNHTPSRT
jgi:anti-sigma factor RsiW